MLDAISRDHGAMSTKENSCEASAELTPAPAPETFANALETEQRLSLLRLAHLRAAAKKSTGPRTAAGKAASRLNAIKHGLFASDVVNARLEGRRRHAEFKALLAWMMKDLAPVGVLERMLVEEIATCCWRIRKVLRSEIREAWIAEDKRYNAEDINPFAALQGRVNIGVLAARGTELELAKLDSSMVLPPAAESGSILRFESRVKRHLHRALSTLVALQEKRRAHEAERGRPRKAETSRKRKSAKRSKQ
jgi:hypothetical protein